MPKKLILALCAILIGLSIYSCSELILPKQVRVKGTLGLPIRVGAADLNSMLAEEVDKAFSASAQKGVKVYNVDYKEQTVQTFCIYIPIEMTEDLNPDDFLKTIDKQINDGIHAEPKKIDVSIPYLGVPIPVDKINMVDNILSVSLAEMARYVITIDFDKCDGIMDSGIGINFNFTEIPDGLEMILACKELNFSTDSKPLKKGNNVFGNSDELTLALEEYKEGKKQLHFFFILLSTGPDPDEWNPAGFTFGDMINIKGEMHLFYKWTKAEIDLRTALKGMDFDNLKGVFPDTPINLSKMRKYLEGGFTFNNLEVKIYMNGPDSDSINALNAKLILEAQYDTKKGMDLYNDTLSISGQVNLDDYLNDDGVYNSQHLPEITSDYNNKINNETILDIFNTMPADLLFSYKIELGEHLTVYPDTFDNHHNDSAGGSKITTTIIIMLPMSLTAAGDNDKKSTIIFPDILGNGDMFGRKKPGDLFSAEDIDYIKMTIDFPNQIFSNGHLFIDKDIDEDIDIDKVLFSQGIRLRGKKTIINFTSKEFEIIQEKLIYPEFKVKIDEGETLNVPKNMGIVNIKLEMKGLVRPGEL